LRRCGTTDGKNADKFRKDSMTGKSIVPRANILIGKYLKIGSMFQKQTYCCESTFRRANVLKFIKDIYHIEILGDRDRL